MQQNNCPYNVCGNIRRIGNLTKATFYILIFVLNSHSIYALDSERIGIPEIQHFNRTTYGGGTQNWDIYQAKNNLLYFANNEGILEYDGSNWKKIAIDNQITHRSLLVEKGRIYTGVFNNFGYYRTNDRGDATFHSLIDSLTPEEKNFDEIWHIFKSDNNIIFQSHAKLFIYDGNKIIVIIKARQSFSFAKKLDNGQIFIQDDGNGVYELQNNSLIKTPWSDFFTGKQLSTIIPIENNALIIATMYNGIFRLFNGKIEKWGTENLNNLQPAIFSGTQLNNKYIFFGTIKNGILVYNNRGDLIQIIDKDRGLQNNTILALFADREGNIWAGLDNGIDCIKFDSPISYLQNYYNIGTGYAIHFDKDQVYIGSNQGLYQISQNKLFDAQKTRYDFHLIPSTEGQVWDIQEINGQILCGHNLGAFIIEHNTAKCITPNHVMGCWLFRQCPNRKDLVLTGTYYGICLLRWSASNQQWEFDRILDGFRESTRYMEWDNAGRLWVSHWFGGIFALSFSPNYDRITKVEHITKNEGLPNDGKNIIFKIDDDILISTLNGLYKPENYDNSIRITKEKRFNRYLKGDTVISYLKEDQNKNIWYRASEKLGVLRRQEDGTYRKITSPFMSINPKVLNSFENIGFYGSEQAFVGIENGFAQYLPQHDKTRPTTFAAYIRGFGTMNREVKETLLSPSNSDQISIQYNKIISSKNNSLWFSYAGVYYENSNIEYAIRLQGYDNAWSEWTKQNFKSYTNLHEGRYTFYVKARNVYGIESNEAKISFEVAAPWYRSAISKVIYLILILALIILIQRINTRKHERARNAEKQKQLQAHKEIEYKLKQEALHAEKELIKLRNEKLNNDVVQKEKELTNMAMNLIQKNNFLTNIKEELKMADHTDDKQDYRKKIANLLRRIDKDINSDQQWAVFETHLDQVHEEFLNRLKLQYTDLTYREIKLCSYLRLGMSSKEIAAIMNITSRAVENNRSKLRSKLGLESDGNLQNFIMNL